MFRVLDWYHTLVFDESSVCKQYTLASLKYLYFAFAELFEFISLHCLNVDDMPEGRLMVKAEGYLGMANCSETSDFEE